MKKGLKRPLDLAIEIARSKPPIISLSEGYESRVVEAAVEAVNLGIAKIILVGNVCLLYTSPSPRDRTRSRMPSSA